MSSNVNINSYFLKRKEMIDFLGRLQAPDDTAKSLYLAAGSTGSISKQNIPPEIADTAEKSRTGMAVFSSSSGGYAIVPPFPLKAARSAPGYDVRPLLALLEHEFTLGLVLVRLGSYAVGLCHGERLAASKVGTGLVHGRHKKGGSSQQRFQRHRDKQIESFLTRVCSHAREVLEPQAPEMDYLAYGGAWTTILELQKSCPFLERLDTASLPPLLDIGEPRQKVLEKAIGRVWSSSVMEWHIGEETSL